MYPKIRHLVRAALVLSFMTLIGIAPAEACGGCKKKGRYVYSGCGTGHYASSCYGGIGYAGMGGYGMQPAMYSGGGGMGQGHMMGGYGGGSMGQGHMMGGYSGMGYSGYGGMGNGAYGGGGYPGGYGGMGGMGNGGMGGMVP